MSRKWFITAVISLIGAVVCFLAAGQAGARPDNYLKDNYQSTSHNHFTCDGDAKTVGEKIAKETRPEAQQFRDEGNQHAFYLRYSKNMVIVTSTPDGQNCTISLEDLGRVNNGAFIFLGPGFSPGSPSGSSGGSSGSGGGVK